MTTTISGTTVTFTDGSTWGGANGALTPDTNSSQISQSFSIGHLILGNTIFTGNFPAYSAGGTSVFAMNKTNSAYYSGQYAAGNEYTVSPAVNLPASSGFTFDHPRHGNQSYFALGGYNGVGALAGSWRVRGMACGAGINQTNGYFVLLERVA